tara:strand:- start:214 stop:438 length:225 start_codon:yes stop_codon:yes gene_type:complete
MNTHKFTPGGWWLEDNTNDVVRVIGPDSLLYPENIPENSVAYQYITDEESRGIINSIVIATTVELQRNFTYRSH